MKWRPTPDGNCLYVVPDIHGANNLLKVLCTQILPLRNKRGCNDTLVFLGDYLDRHTDTHLLLDTLVEIQEEFPNQTKFLKGNHEDMFLKTLNLVPGKETSLQSQASNYKCWMNVGGEEMLQGYMDRHNMYGFLPKDLEKFRIESLLPKKHLTFLQNLLPYYKQDNFIFVHGGMDPLEPIEKQDHEMLWWDRSLLQNAMSLNRRGIDFPWNEIIVTGHNMRDDRKPIVFDKFMMLDAGSPEQLLCVEMYSMTAMMARPGKMNLQKYELTL